MTPRRAPDKRTQAAVPRSFIEKRRVREGSACEMATQARECQVCTDCRLQREASLRGAFAPMAVHKGAGMHAASFCASPETSAMSAAAENLSARRGRGREQRWHPDRAYRATAGLPSAPARSSAPARAASSIAARSASWSEACGAGTQSTREGRGTLAW
jgi:hypothetical protein